MRELDQIERPKWVRSRNYTANQANFCIRPEADGHERQYRVTSSHCAQKATRLVRAISTAFVGTVRFLIVKGIAVSVWFDNCQEFLIGAGLKLRRTFLVFFFF